MYFSILSYFYLLLGLESIRSEISEYNYDQPDQIHLSLSDAIDDGMVVTWSTFNATSESIVNYGWVPNDFKMSQKGNSSSFKSSDESTRIQYIHRVVLKNLPSDTRVYYNVGSDLGWSEIFWFKTFGKGKPTKMAVYGDLGNVNSQSLSRLQEEVQSGKYDMIFHVGDFAYDLDSDDGLVGDEFMRQIQPIAAYLPYMTCNGNHESAGNFRNYRNRFTMPEDPEMKKMYYSFNTEYAHIISLSTEYYYFPQFGYQSAHEQYQWLIEDLKNANLPKNRSKRPWIIVFGHRPPYCSAITGHDCKNEDAKVRVGIPSQNLPGLEDLLAAFKVDLNMWAHVHSYERLWPMYNFTVMNGSSSEPYTNAKAPINIITGSAGNQEYHPPGFRSPPPYWSAFRSNDYGYTRIYVDNRTHLHVQQVSDDKDGEVVDDVWIIKNDQNYNYYNNIDDNEL